MHERDIGERCSCPSHRIGKRTSGYSGKHHYEDTFVFLLKELSQMGEDVCNKVPCINNT